MGENLNNNKQSTMKEPNKKEPSAKTKKKKAKIAVICLCSICVILLGLQIYAATNGYGNVFFMIRDWTTTKTATGEDEVFKEEKTSVEELDVNSELVKKLYEYILKDNDGSELIAYQNKKVTKDNLGNNVILMTVFENMSNEYADEVKKENRNGIEATHYYFDKDKVEKKAMELFGKDVKVQHQNCSYNLAEEIIYKDGKYDRYKFQGGGDYIWSDSTEKIVKVEEDENGLYIYDEYVHIIRHPDNSNEYDIYNASDRKVKLASNVKLEKLIGNDYNKDQILKNAKEITNNKIITFKHTFIKNSDGNYYWYSTEPIKEDSNTSETTNTDNNNDKDLDFFEKNTNIQYDNDLTNSQNGKAAIVKTGEEILKTTQNDGYYTYTDMWNNSYNIKKIKDVKSEFTHLGKDKQSALYKCTIYYIDNNNKDKSFDVAVIVSKDAEGGILGTYDSYTGSTRFTRWVGLYDEGNTENTQLEPDNYSEEVMKDEKETKDYLGVWKVKKAYRDTKEVNLQEIYGTSVKYGVGNLSMNMDGTFTDKIAPLYESEDSRAGKYMINENEIVLKYNNGSSRNISYSSGDKVITYNVFDNYYLVMEKQGE